MGRNTYICRLEVVCAREASKTTTVQIGDVTKELEYSVFQSNKHFKGDLHIGQLDPFWLSASRKLLNESKEIGS